MGYLLGCAQNAWHGQRPGPGTSCSSEKGLWASFSVVRGRKAPCRRPRAEGCWRLPPSCWAVDLHLSDTQCWAVDLHSIGCSVLGCTPSCIGHSAPFLFSELLPRAGRQCLQRRRCDRLLPQGTAALWADTDGGPWWRRTGGSSHCCLMGISRADHTQEVFGPNSEGRGGSLACLCCLCSPPLPRAGSAPPIPWGRAVPES